MNISVICPVLNEAPYAKAWAECVSKWADEVIIYDMGSTDETRNILAPYHFSLTQHLGDWGPYRWPEGNVRNSMIAGCNGDWIVNLDMDELIDWNPRDYTHTNAKFIRCQFLDFWYSPRFLRCADPRDFKSSWKWFWPVGSQIRMFRNDKHIKYSTREHPKYPGLFNHTYLEWYGLGKYSPRLSESGAPPFFHYHRCRSLKVQDNRAPDWKRTGQYLRTYYGPHPIETRYYDWFGSFVG